MKEQKEIKERIELLLEEIQANEEEIRIMEKEVSELYKKLKLQIYIKK